MKAIIGRKIGMTQIIDEDGRVSAVTIIEAKPNIITQIKNTEKDGYSAIQLGYETSKNAPKPQKNHAKKHAKVDLSPKYFREFKTEEALETGASIDVSAFEVGDLVDVTGTSKGKGFAGTIKRHNFMRSRKTHGGKGDVRKVGSIGSMYPQKVFKGKRMAGQMGAERVTTRGLTVAVVDQEAGYIGVIGSVPGPRKGILLVKGEGVKL